MSGDRAQGPYFKYHNHSCFHSKSICDLSQLPHSRGALLGEDKRIPGLVFLREVGVGALHCHASLYSKQRHIIQCVFICQNCVSLIWFYFLQDTVLQK